MKLRQNAIYLHRSAQLMYFNRKNETAHRMKLSGMWLNAAARPKPGSFLNPNEVALVLIEAKISMKEV